MLAATRQIVRSLRRIPGFSAVVVGTFALGIGATTLALLATATLAVTLRGD